MKDKGYEIIFDNTTNRPIAIERATGEVYETTTRTVPVGSIFYTPEQQRDYQERNKAKEEKQMYRKCADALGNYSFISADSSINTIKPETLTRLIYLCTYGEYNTGRLRKTQRTIMKKSDLPAVLNVSESTALRFFNDAQNYITENKNGELILCRTLFKKGALSKQEYIPYQKIYSKAFRELYQRSSPNMHKRMGYIFQLIPYINIEHNVLCYNPDEQNFCDIKFMSTQDFCSEIGYSFPMFYRLRKAFSKLTINYNGNEEPIILFVKPNAESDEEHIYINPHIIYCGKNCLRIELPFGCDSTESSAVSQF